MLPLPSQPKDPSSPDLDRLLDLFKQLDITQINALLSRSGNYDWHDLRQQLLAQPGEEARYTEEGNTLAREADYALMRARTERTWPGWYAVGPLADWAADLLLAQRHRDAISDDLWDFVSQPWKRSSELLNRYSTSISIESGGSAIS